MTIADDTQNPRPSKKLAKSLDAVTALRIAMEQRLAEKAGTDPDPTAPETAPQESAENTQETPSAGAAAATAPSETSDPGTTDKTDGPAPSAKGPGTSSGPKTEAPTLDPSELPGAMMRIAERSQKMIYEYMERNKEKPLSFFPVDPGHVGEAFMELMNRLVNDPERFADAQITLWQGYIRIWQTTLARLHGEPAEPLIKPAAADKRFQDQDWQNIWLFDYIKQTYLLTAKWVQLLVKQESKTLDPHLARKIDFYTRQMVDAISPSNFWMTNPEVLRTTVATGGENFVKGLEKLLDDLERGGGQLRVSMTDNQAFQVGKNLATTPGKVVFQNRLIQLIQYDPVTPSVHRVPLLIMPPWINKYYILDLNEKKSLIRYLVAEGYTVFCISWVNPDERHADVNFDDYMQEGSLAAMREVRRATGENDINVVGYCIGGTLLASTLAYLKAVPVKPEGLPEIKSATYYVTMIDFSEPGDLGVFIDEDQIEAIEEKMGQQGFLDAASMATTFNLLRSNDLIWSFVVNNYLLGKEPFPFDILYWNGDSTNLPKAMHSFYLRKMYLENKLVVPRGLAMKGVPIDVRDITTPSFLLSTSEDHIAPWKSTYAATQLYKGPLTFVLSGSGHIAGVVNPPAANKYGYWTNSSCPAEPDEWLKSATQHQGSWWPEWMKWLQDYAGEQVPARQIDATLESAPGSYARVRVV